MKKVLLMAILALTVVSTASAQVMRISKEGEGKYTVSGRVMEAFEGTPMPEVAVEIMNEDSVVVATTTTVGKKGETKEHDWFGGTFMVNLKTLGKYIAKFSCVGYETKYVNFQLKYRRELAVGLDDVLLQKEEIMLDEVTVKATKVKMVFHGDTIIYNADAFHLAEGSMLDELIRRLPGAELSSNGTITINGKRVSTLLVNGKDFFTGDPKLALKNLPAYTVNKVKVYDQRGIASELMGKDMNDKNFVMDVRLKKEYSSGWVVNAVGGYGTKDRYTGKLMALHFSEVSQEMIFGNSNNLGQNSVYNADFGDWTGGGTPTEESQYHNAGFAYQYQVKEGRKSDRFASTNTVSYSEVNSKNWSSTQNFLEGGDTYGRSNSISKNKSFRISTDNRATKWMSKGSAEASLRASYAKNDAEQQSFSAMFNADPISFRDLQKDVFGAENRFEDITLNRSKSITESSGKTFNVAGNSYFFINVFGDLVRASIDVSYENQTGSSFSLSDYDYAQTGASDRRNNYTDTPSHDFSASASAAYDYSIDQTTNVSLDYDFNHRYNRTNNMLYRLDRIDGRGEDTPFNVLPSTAAALNAVLDSPNSYTYGQRNITNKLTPGFSKRAFLKDGNFLSLSLNVPIEINTNTLNYFREQNYHMKQNRVNVNPNIDISFMAGRAMFSVGGKYSSMQPGMTSMITFRDDSNPLYVSLGNADLKDTHDLHFDITASSMGAKSGYDIRLEYLRTYNAMATSTVYDKTTGVTTSKPVNINGNWQATCGANTRFTFGKDGNLEISNDLDAAYQCSVDLNSVAGGTVSEPSKVNNVNVSDRLAMKWEITSKIDLSLHAGDSFRHQASAREGFSTVNAHDINYGGEVKMELPWHLQFVSTVEQTSRRGYSDKQMNTDELVWNAKLQRSFLKGKLLASVEGYDILGQRSNRHYMLNSQGRTESYSNVIPSFGMVTLSYRFVKTPKNKNIYNINANGPTIIRR